ncbi:hypothetical protein BS78_09G091100 [Paspalum vaginatum]|uniref:Uncharacterized protein n=1 Tax=Paspalum vaginatum TaxID=158149 RepID=A0A9W7X809_9POAL|nr:hypothetical protein BS78_K199900 [Paspalum vaginatum]KAJ1262231.1 hypothetical protein BS78_09G091100 [Paspalum vaginatum]KAJ1262234.1 hypothetical protein BS78_09G091100 [Paspalum vaginatum]
MLRHCLRLNRCYLHARSSWCLQIREEIIDHHKSTSYFYLVPFSSFSMP